MSRTCEKCGQEIQGKHYDDLTKVDVPFNQLDADTQARLRALPDEAVQSASIVKPYQWYNSEPCDRSRWNRQPYRQNPDWVDKSNRPEKPEGIVECGGKRWRVKGDAPVEALSIEIGIPYFLDMRSLPVVEMTDHNAYRSGILRWLAEEVKPEYRPWTAEEAIGKVVRFKIDNGCRMLLSDCRPNYVRVHSGWRSYEDLLDCCVQLNDSPCGVEVKP